MSMVFGAVLLTLAAACSPESPANQEWRLEAQVRDMQGLASGTKVSYSGAYGEHSEFETGDCFGLFVINSEGTVTAKNLKVYCSGLSNDGKSVWSIYKEASGEGNSSNHPISDILGKGSSFFAYFPYSGSLDDITTPEGLKDYVVNFSLPADQSSSYEACDLLVASNLSDYQAGEISVSGKTVRINFAHVFSLLRFFLPEGSVKYEYFFSGADFTPHLMGTDAGKEEYRYIFKPGPVLDICLKYVHGGKLYRIETGNTKNIWPLETQAGHCYFLDENAVKVPYSVAVDMGTSVMWSSFNLGAEDEPGATMENISGLKGYYLMWGVNVRTDATGNAAYTKYNGSFTAGTKPGELPTGYDYSGDANYDAARNIWGGKWRTPSYPEWEELFAACSYKVANNAITFTSSSTGNSITLPYCGYNDGTPTALTTGYYLSSTASADNIAKTIAAYFKPNIGSPGPHNTANRYTGLPLRPVYTK